MACCSFSELVSGDCGSSLDNPTNIKCVTLRECTKEVYSHLVFCKVSDDSEIDTEWKLLLARAAMNICPRHRDLFGVRWRSSKTNCTIPDEIASHKSKAKGLCGLRRKQSQFVYHRTQKLIPVGSKICKRCKEHLTGSLSIDASFQSFHDQPELVTPNVIEEPTPKSLTIKARKEVSSSSSDELTEGIRGIKITDESYLLSSDAGSEVSSTTDASGASSDDCARRQKLNVFLEECGIQPLGRAWLAWREISERTKERYLKQTSEIVSSVLRVISSENSPDLWKELQSSCIVNDMLGISQTTLPSEVAYLEALAEAYKLAKSWDTRRQVLSTMAGVASFKSISEYIPGLTRYRFTMANLHGLQHGRGAQVPKKSTPHFRIDRQQLDHFLGFITSPHLIQDLPFGEKHLQLSNGKVLTVPNVIRTMIPNRIVLQYKRFCAESNFKPFSDSTMLRVLSECSASVRKSLQGLDYLAADGSRAFDTLAEIIEVVSSKADGGKKWADEMRETLKEGKFYLKGDYKVHVNDQSHVADHCTVFALSDKSDADFRKECDHSHDEVCDQCEALSAAIEDVKKVVQNAAFDSIDDKEEYLYLCHTAAHAIQAWKCHQLRSVRQDQARLDVIESLNEERVFIVSDWAMKFLPQMFRESQQDWFGKRGISWHISVVFRRLSGVLQSQAFVHVIQSCSQESHAAVMIMQHVLQTLKSEHPEVTQAFFRQDNAGCYHCSNTVSSLAQMERVVGIKVIGVDFSDPQGGKGPADRLAATCKCHIRIHINEGHNVTTAHEMKEALLSHGGIAGVRVAVIPCIEEPSVLEQKIPGINKLNNFAFTDDGLLVYRAYGIGPGKSLSLHTDSGAVTSISTPFSAGDFKEVAQKPVNTQTHCSTSEAAENVQESDSEGSGEAAVFSCPQEGCVRVFQRLSSLEKHLSLESCTKTLERQSLSDIAKITYASLLQEGAAPIPSTCPTSTEHRVVSSSILSEGWALRAPKKSYRFNTKQKEYLEAKFNVGQVTGRKVNPDVVAKDMRRARDEGGEKLFSSSEFLTVQQVTSFFSRLAAKRRQQLATEEDVCAATEEENFCTARESVLSSLDLQHPITYDQFNICALVRESKLNKLKVAMLQVICEALNLETPVPAVKRKAPYTALLVDAVSKCSCSDTG
ncbi:uncharacterized protein LOC144656433 [Oculina patagonica]